MKHFFIALFFIAVNATCYYAQKNITVEDLWGKYAFMPKAAAGFNVMNDGMHYTDIEADGDFNNIVKYNLRSGKKTSVLVKGSTVKVNDKGLDISDYSFSPDESKLFFTVEVDHIYRRSSVEKNYVYDTKTGKIEELSDKGKQMFATFSPKGNLVAFVRENNLFIKDLDKHNEIQVTTDGKNNEIKNGWADWVYEEEFSKANYFTWNSDGTKLAYVRFDERKVKEYTFDTYNNNLYPDKVTFKYPKAGEDNSVLSVHIFDVATIKTTQVDIGNVTDIYIPRIQWTTDRNILSLQRMNRLQNKLELLFADATTGNTKTILTDEAKTYIDITDDLTFLPNSRGFIWSSETDNYNHLYYYDINGKLMSQITKGNWDVISFNGYDEKLNTLFYISTERGPINRDVYSIKLDGTTKKRLSTAEGTTGADFSTGLKYYVSNWSDANTPPVYELHSADGKLVKVLEDNTDLKTKIKDYNLSKKDFFTFKNSEGVELNGWMMKPRNFDPVKKYPVYMFA